MWGWGWGGKIGNQNWLVTQLVGPTVLESTRSFTDDVLMFFRLLRGRTVIEGCDSSTTLNTSGCGNAML